MQDRDFEQKAYPDLFPTGSGGYNPNENNGLSLRRYFQQRLCNVDGRFAKNVEYLFAAQYIIELKQVKEDSTLVLRQQQGNSYRNAVVNAGILKEKGRLTDLIRTDQAYKFLKNVRGTPAYWQQMLYDVLALLRQRGTPTFFLTFSCADLQWQEFIQAIGKQYGHNFTDEEVHNMSWQIKTSWLNTNPVTAARMFEHRLSVFKRDFLFSKAAPIGEITDFVFKIEFQGSPHAHAIIYVKDTPKLDVQSDEEVCNFVDHNY